ncbi:hypothetical protein ACIQVO_39225 [Streptomyces sp. NPDC101062]|uniref:hypothetical protein n=1 Tax=unclassified Streptomyces TaxID=2593676 RepID=UPI003805B86F
MSEQPPNRTRRLRTTGLVVAAALAAIGGLGAWQLLGTDEGPTPCDGLLADRRVQEVLSEESRSGTGCAGLGEAIRKATVADSSGRHTSGQALAMRTVLSALAKDVQRRGDHTLDPGLRRPVADALADYAGDVHALLGSGNAASVKNGAPSAGPWQEKDGYHMAVPRDSLLLVVRAVSEDPLAYVAVRDAQTLRAAEALSDVAEDARGFDLSAPASNSARVLATLDAVAEDVLRDRDRGRDGEEAEGWRSTVVAKLADGPVRPPSYADDPVRHLVGTWRSALRSAKGEDAFPALREQGVRLVEIWSAAGETDDKTSDSLVRTCRASADSAYNAALRSLDE